MHRTNTLGVLAVVATVFLCGGCAASEAEHGSAAGGGAAAPEIAARIGDTPVTVAEIDAKAKSLDMAPYQALFDARSAALEQLVAERLLAAEAKKRSISTDELVAAEITGKTAGVTPEDVKKFFDENQPRMGGRTLEQVGPQIEQFLASQKAQEARSSYIAKLREAAGVMVLLDPPRVEVAAPADAPSKGPVDAPVQIVMFSEFECPYCKRVEPTMAELRESYGDKLRIVFRDFPLPFHGNAQKASEAALCAHEQDRFWAYHDKLFENQQALGEPSLRQYAADLGLDTARFNECLDSGRMAATIQVNVDEGRSLGVQGTPGFFINGRFVRGAQPIETFRNIIDDELRRKKA